MNYHTIRNLMLSMLVLGLAGSASLVGTFATFNATVTNTGSTFASAQVSFESGEPAGTNVCKSTNGAAAATVSGTGCATTLTKLTSVIVPGDSKFGEVQLTNDANVPVLINLAVADTAADSNALSFTAPGAAKSTTTNAGMGLLVFECTNAAGTTDQDCNTGGGSTLQLVYGSCFSVLGGTGSSVTSVTIAHTVTATDFSTTNVAGLGTPDNGIQVGGSGECYAGNTATGLGALTNVPIVASSGSPKVAGANQLAATSKDSLLVVIWLPVVSGSTQQNITSPNLTYSWTAVQLAGTSH